VHDPIPPIVNDRVQDLRVAPQVPASSSDARQAAILEAIRAIPAGFVRTYGDVSPGAPRLAGRLLSSINAPDLPWWRVVRADGSLAAGPEQRERLEAEGVPFRPGARPRIDLGVARVWSG
jgi:alkylated DNA nucleotide flippase Atl1